MNTKRNILLLTLLLMSKLIFSQAFSVDAKIDSTVIYIGQQCNMTFEIHQKNGIKVEMPNLADTIVKGIDIVSVKTDTVNNQNGEIIVKRSYLITSFDSALYYVPQFVFVYNGDTLLSNSMSLKVLTVPIDTTKAEIAIADIKPIVQPPFDWETFRKIAIIIAIVVLVLSILVWLLLRYLKKRKTEVVEEKIEEIIKTCDEIALEQLETIRLEKIWQSGRTKEYYTQITDVLRQYLHHRFGIVTLERTSSEIVEALRFIKKEYQNPLISLNKIFTTSDMVKFAKMIPDFNINTTTLEAAIEFVLATKQSTENQMPDVKK